MVLARGRTVRGWMAAAETGRGEVKDFVVRRGAFECCAVERCAAEDGGVVAALGNLAVADGTVEGCAALVRGCAIGRWLAGRGEVRGFVVRRGALVYCAAERCAAEDGAVGGAVGSLVAVGGGGSGGGGGGGREGEDSFEGRSAMRWSRVRTVSSSAAPLRAG